MLASSHVPRKNRLNLLYVESTLNLWLEDDENRESNLQLLTCHMCTEAKPEPLIYAYSMNVIPIFPVCGKMLRMRLIGISRSRRCLYEYVLRVVS